MSSTHRLHRVHTGRTESDAVAVTSAKACNSCLEPLSLFDRPAFYCSQCDYTVCDTCDKPKSHPVHPQHSVFYITPTSSWRCDVCKRNSEHIQEKQCYYCEQCDFHICKKCYAGINSSLHAHVLYRTDVSHVYLQSNGEWACDVCRNNNGPGHFFPAHCAVCQFDLCDNCIKPYRSTFHQGHIMYKADPNLVYPRFNGGWRCDRCSRSFIPQMNNIPYHCSQCEFDLCESCMKTTGETSNSAGFDVPRMTNQEYFSGPRSGAPLTVRGNPIAISSDDLPDSRSGRPGPPDASSGECVICLERPKDATIVHGATGHVCCCTACAEELRRTGAKCPICRAPIERVIKQYTV